MTLEHYVIAGLFCYTLIRELFFMYSMQKLVNKLMSRDYYSYQVSNSAPVITDKPSVLKEDGLNEDMSTVFS